MSLPQRFKKLSLIFSYIVALVGLLVLIGWIGDITVLKSISPYWISMKANAAICFLLAGSTLILVNRGKNDGTAKWVITFFSFVVFIIGCVTVLEYVFKFNSGIDELIFKDNANTFPKVSSGRQSPFSAAYFMLFGFCYLPGIYKKISVSLFQLLHIISGIFVLAAAMSYLFGSYIIAGISLDFIFVIHSTIAFLFLIMAVLFSQPEKGYMKLVSSNTTGGKIIRKYLPAFLFIFVVIGWLGLRGEQTGFFNAVFSVSLLIILMIVIFGFALFSGAASLANSEVILKQSEEKLLHSNKALEAAEKMAKLGSWEYNMNGQEGIWSKQIFRLLGLPIADKAPSFKEFLELIHTDERNLAQEIFDQMVDGIEIEDKVFRTNPEKGEVKYLLLDWHVIKDADGKPSKYFGTLQCVTERVKATDTLKQSEELFKKAFHSKVFGLAIVNNERRVVDINETLTSLLGYNREDFIGKTSVEIGLTDPKYIKKRDELLLALLSNGKIENYELDMVTRHGKPISLVLSVEPMNLNNNPHWLIYLFDVTEKRKAEKELTESEKRLSRAEKMGSLGHGYFDILNNKMNLSDGLYKIFGVSPDKFSHTIEGLKSVIHPGDFLIQEKAVDTMFKEGSVEVEFRILRPDGEVRNVLFKTALTKNKEGEVLNSFTTALDITESKKAEEQIRYYNLQLKQLAANLQNVREEERTRIGREIHDELGQWLTVLKLEIARVKKIKGDEKKLNESIEEMLIQVDGCIKSSRRISTDLRPPIIDDLGLIAALQWQAEDFGKRANIKSVFKADIKKLDLPPDFTIGIFRIFQESLTNVTRHAEATIVTSKLSLFKGELILNITDNGKGFNTATIGSKKTLGLIGMKERTLLMNGTYDINSSPGMGTQIMVIIPIPVV
jgi:PAS domain S-box-containing protein